MLKIKDNVDLKELEKFGFEEYGNYMRKELEDGNYLDISLEKNFFHKKRELTFSLGAYNTFVNVSDTLYDLIKADLVEKIEQ